MKPKNMFYKLGLSVGFLFLTAWLLWLTIHFQGLTEKKARTVNEKPVQMLMKLIKAYHNDTNQDDMRNRRGLIGHGETHNLHSQGSSGDDNILNAEEVCDGNVAYCKEMENAFNDERFKIKEEIKTDYNLTMLSKVESRETKYVTICIDDYKIPNQTVTNNGEDFWLSPMHREHFYEECLQNFDIKRLQRKGVRAVKKMQQFASDLSDGMRDKGEVQIGGGTAQVVGGIMGGIGLVLAPFTAGTSLMLNFAGAGLATSGSLASFIQPFLTEKWTGELISESTRLAKETEEKMDLVNTLMGLFIDSQTKREKYLGSSDFQKINDEFISLFLIKMRGAFLSTLNLGKFAAGGRAAYINYVRKNPATIPSRLSTKFASIRKPFTSFKGMVAFKSMKGWGISSAVTGKITAFASTGGAVTRKITAIASPGAAVTRKITAIASTGGAAFLSGFNVVFGVWDIISGTQSIEGKGDLSDTFWAASKAYSYDIDSTLEMYEKIIGSSNVNGYKDSYQEVTRIALKSVNGQVSAGTKLRLNGIDPNNPDDPQNSCTTKIIDENSGNALPSGYWYFVDGKELGNCNFFKIFNDSANIQVQNDYSDAVEFSHVTISTETRLVPALACSKDGTYATINTSKMYSDFGTGLSEELKCFAAKGINMVKMHTCETFGAGTDGDVRLHITQFMNDSSKNDAYCTTDWLDNKGDDREQGQVDTYRIDVLGKCSKPFHDDFDPEHGGYLSTSIEHSSPWYVAGTWCLDTLKLYGQTSVGETKAFKCNVGTEWLNRNNKTKSKICTLQKPDPRGIEKVKLHVTDNYWADSWGIIRLKICNDKDQNHASDEHDCCTTNQVDGVFTGNKYFTIDGEINELQGEDLGQCESFIVKGSSVTIRVKKEDDNSVSFDRIELYGASDLLVTTSDIPFLKCSGKEIWAESEETYLIENGMETSWMHWDNADVTWLCTYTDHTTIKKVHVRLCSDSTAGTSSTIETEFINIEGTPCSTESLFTEDTKLGNGDFHTFNNIGNCSSLEVIDSRVSMNLKNKSNRDNLCLTHIWLDVSDSGGQVKQLQCRFHAKKRELNVIRSTGSHLPLVCQ